MILKTEKLQMIGPHTVVSFPRYGLNNIPAKIDTGADSTSIWASKIKEENGVLSFSLFDKQSPFFTGERISTSSYELTDIKNSFGNTETRYKVKTILKIENRTLRVNCTLADRSNNKFPVLIGKRTLRGKFLVNVSNKRPKTI